MIVLDVNVLVNAHRSGMPAHQVVHDWLSDQLRSGTVIGLPDHSVMGFLRLVTNRRVFPVVTPIDEAINFCIALKAAPTVRTVGPGARHWSLWSDLIAGMGLRAKDIPDAYLAALALENSATLATSDRGFARFANLSRLDPAQIQGKS